SKGKEAVKPITPPYESVYEEDSDEEHAQRDKQIQKNLQFTNQRAIVAGVRETAGNQGDWLDDIDEEPDQQELEAHYMYMTKIHEVLTAESRPSFDAEPLEQVQINDDYNVFANERHHSEQPESINDTYVVEKAVSNAILNSSNMCDNKGKVDQNAEEYKDECVMLANLIANLKLDTDENKKIQNKLKKEKASLAHELKVCKYALEESNDI
nr:hypothetical protein [Tanacetum cinerariifolium]